MRFSEAVQGLVLVAALGLPAGALAQACGAGGEAFAGGLVSDGLEARRLSGTVQAGRVNAKGDGPTEPVKVSFTGSTNRLENGYRRSARSSPAAGAAGTSRWRCRPISAATTSR